MVVTVLLACVSLWLLSTVKRLLEAWYAHVSGFSDHAIAWAMIPIAAATAFSITFYKTQYSDFLPLMRISLRSSAVGLLVYLLVEPPDFTTAFEHAAGRGQYVQLGYFLAVTLGALSVVRPSFQLPVAFYILSTRLLVESISGLAMSTLDIRYMLDMAVYLALFAIPAVAIGPRMHDYFCSPERQTEIAFVAFGLHLGNYFWSGIAKLLVGPRLWTWVLENKTYNTIPYALEKGTLPIGHIPWLVEFSHQGMQWLQTPLNAAIAGFQVFAIVCVFRMIWLKLASLLYDLLHLGIWLFGGLFFWPWVWNNFTILLAARGERGTIPLSAKVACVLTILLGYPAFKLQEFAWLGWFDVVDVRQTYFQALTRDGRALRVPTSFFLSHSYSVSHGYMDTVPHEGHYADTSSWGSARSYKRLLTSGTCPNPEPVAPETLETSEGKTARLDRVGAFVRAHHQKMKAREQLLGKTSYYWRAHHHPSNPFLFHNFNDLSVNDIIAYNLVVESDCLRLRDGKTEKTVVARLVERFDVE